MRSKGLKLRLIALLMTISMTLSFVSCSLSSFRSKIISDPISKEELVRLLITAINSNKNAADCYASIPEIQREGLSYSYFIQYIDILNDISSPYGSVSYFRMLSDEEVFEISEQMDDSYYGNIKGAELLYGEDRIRNSVYVLFSEDEDGTAYLSEEWITDIINLYNYGKHYFEMIDNENIDGLFTLMRPGLDPEVYTDQAVYAKAQNVLDYYDDCVIGGDVSKHFMVTTMLPEHVTMTVPETLNYNNSRVVKHDVDIIVNDEETYEIEDEIPVLPDVALTVASLDSRELFTCGETYTAEDMVELMDGEPSRGTYYADRERFSVSYQGVIFVFEIEEYEDDSNWTGTLVTIKIQEGSHYFIGNGLYVGMNRSDLLELYPYLDDPDLDETTYEIEVDNGLEDCNVEIVLDNSNNISYIRITVV